jgi:hypothetical protein
MTDSATSTDWKPCGACGSMTRHDQDICIRDKRHPRYDARRGTGLRPDLPHSQPKK